MCGRGHAVDLDCETVDFKTLIAGLDTTGKFIKFIEEKFLPETVCENDCEFWISLMDFTIQCFKEHYYKYELEKILDWMMEFALALKWANSLGPTNNPSVGFL